MGIIYVVGSTSGSGSTATIAGLEHEWSKSGKSVLVVKPFAFDQESTDTEANLFSQEIEQHQIYQEKSQIKKATEMILGISKSA